MEINAQWNDASQLRGLTAGEDGAEAIENSGESLFSENGS